MSDEVNGLLKDSVEGLIGTIAAVAGYIGIMSIGSSKKLAELGVKIDALANSIKDYRVDDLRWRIEVIRRLEWLEHRRDQQDNRERRDIDGEDIS